MTVKELISEIEKKPARSAWDRGVKAYAIELAEGIEDEDAFANKKLMVRHLLNGADDWYHYSESGCAFVFNGDIAERLCTPSELKKYKYGSLSPHHDCMFWIKEQARALLQASNMICKIVF